MHEEGLCWVTSLSCLPLHIGVRDLQLQWCVYVCVCIMTLYTNVGFQK